MSEFHCSLTVLFAEHDADRIVVDGIIDHPVPSRSGPVSFALSGDGPGVGAVSVLDPFADWAATGEAIDLTVVHHGDVVWLMFRGDDASAVCLTDSSAGSSFFDGTDDRW
ncbi:MAG: hypothetical protein WEB78_11065 [Ilumatobacteraceae bacterium]